MGNPAATTDDITPKRPVSLVARLRAEHERREPTIDLPVPRFDDDVVVRYGRVPTKTITQAGRGKSARMSNAGILVDACRDILVRDDDGKLVSVAKSEGLDVDVVRFDSNLVDLFELRGDTPREVALSMYRDDVAVARQAKEIFDWQTGVRIDEMDDEEVDELAGEADAAT